MNIIFFIFAWYVIITNSLGVARNMFLLKSLGRNLDADDYKNNMISGNVYCHIMYGLSLWHMTNKWHLAGRIAILVFSFYACTVTINRIGNHTIDLYSIEKAGIKRSRFLLRAFINFIMITTCVFLSRFFT